MGEPADRIARGDGLKRGPDRGAVIRERAGRSGSEAGFHLGEGLLDRIEIGRVGRRVPEVGAARLDGGTSPVTVVDLEVVDDHDLAWLQGGCEAMNDVAVERCAVDRLVEQQAGPGPIQRQRRDQRPVRPASVGHVPTRPLSARCTAVGPSQPKVAAGLVDPDEPSRLNPTDLLALGGPLRFVALAGPSRLFFRVHPQRWVIARLIVA